MFSDGESGDEGVKDDVRISHEDLAESKQPMLDCLRSCSCAVCGLLKKFGKPID